METFEKIIEPVSYTHLDVYKRQIIQNSQYEGNLGVELCASLDEFLSNVEHLYTRYKHSIPSTMSECKSRKYFKALSDKDLEDEDMLFGVGRDLSLIHIYSRDI